MEIEFDERQPPLDVPGQCCGNCRFWWGFEDPNDEERETYPEGTCQRYPPSLNLDDDTNGPLARYHPETNSSEWCGEHQHRKPAQILKILPPPRPTNHEDKLLLEIVTTSAPIQLAHDGNWIPKKLLNQRLKQADWDLKAASKTMALLKAHGLIDASKFRDTTGRLAYYVRATQEGQKKASQLHQSTIQKATEGQA